MTPALVAATSLSPMTIILAATALIAAGGLLTLGGLLSSRESWKNRAQVLDENLADANEKIDEQGTKIAQLEKRVDVSELTAQVQEQHAAIMAGLERILGATVDLGRTVQANTLALQGLALQIHAEPPVPIRRAEG